MNSNKKVLIIEDEEDVSYLYEKILKSMAISYDIAITAEEGIRLLQKREYLLIISDMNLPVMGGLEILEEAKKISKDTKVIIVSGSNIPEKTIRIIKENAHLYFEKPFKIDEIKSAIEKIIAAG